MDIKKVKSASKTMTANQEGIFELIKSRKDKIEKILPVNTNSSAFMNQAILAISTNPKLMQCKPESILKALMECASYGLEPNGSLSEAALVPYGNRVEFLIEYRGLMKLVWNSGLVKSMHFDKICSEDNYVYKIGKDVEFSHSPNLADRGEPIAYYATANLVNGGFVMHIMTIKEIMTHGNKYSKSYSHKTSPWKTDFDAMAYKTVIRQLCDKKLPKDTQNGNARLLYKASHLEDHPEEKREELVKSMEIKADIQKDEFKDTAIGLYESIVKTGVSEDVLKEQLFNICGKNDITDTIPADKQELILEKLNEIYNKVK